jgi:hypothetical protein
MSQRQGPLIWHSLDCPESAVQSGCTVSRLRCVPEAQRPGRTSTEPQVRPPDDELHERPNGGSE